VLAHLAPFLAIGPERFTVPGEPVPKARPRAGKGKVYTPRRTLAYEARVRQAARAGCRVAYQGPVTLVVDFYLGTRRRVDVDNLLKSVADALNGVAYGDDTQVVCLVGTKRLDRQNPRAEVRLYLVGEP